MRAEIICLHELSEIGIVPESPFNLEVSTAGIIDGPLILHGITCHAHIQQNLLEHSMIPTCNLEYSISPGNLANSCSPLIRPSPLHVYKVAASNSTDNELRLFRSG